MPNPSTSGTTLAQVTTARSRLLSDGALLATTQPIRKCVIGLMESGSTLARAGTECSKKILRAAHELSLGRDVALRRPGCGLRMRRSPSKATRRDADVAARHPYPI